MKSISITELPEKLMQIFIESEQQVQFDAIRNKEGISLRTILLYLFGDIYTLKAVHLFKNEDSFCFTGKWPTKN